MNELIKELAQQAGAQPTNLPPNVTLDWQKFAELIVRECLNICLECIDDGCVEAQEPMWKIEQHFGVES
jgi:hypothetical protein